MDEAKQDRWDGRYLRLAREVATWSKDPSTCVGAILVRPNNTIAETGYNGFPPGHDDSPYLYADRVYKHQHVIHAEENAIRRASYTDKTDATLYVSFPCCPRCTKLAISERVARIVCTPLSESWAGKDEAWVKMWEESLKLSLELAAEAGVEMLVRASKA